MNQQLLFTSAEAARELKMETARVKALVTTGQLKCYRFGPSMKAPYRIGRMHITQYQRECD